MAILRFSKSVKRNALGKRRRVIRAMPKRPGLRKVSAATFPKFNTASGAYSFFKELFSRKHVYYDPKMDKMGFSAIYTRPELYAEIKKGVESYLFHGFEQCHAALSKSLDYNDPSPQPLIDKLGQLGARNPKAEAARIINEITRRCLQTNAVTNDVEKSVSRQDTLNAFGAAKLSPEEIKANKLPLLPFNVVIAVNAKNGLNNIVTGYAFSSEIIKSILGQ